MTRLATATPASTLNDPDLQGRIAELRRTDNLRGWIYLLREYAYLAVVLGAACWVLDQVYLGRLSWIWGAVTTLVALPLVGAGQHRLATLTHEASHYMLFRNRLLNEFISEWFCMFPLLGTTHRYRVQHLGHHQFPNDPVRDPDWEQLTLSGHKFHFPMSRTQFFKQCILKQLRPLYLLKYIVVRALYKVDREDGGKYRMKRRGSPWMIPLALGYYAALLTLLATAVMRRDASLLGYGAAAMLAGVLVVYTLLPERWFDEWGITPDFTCRTTARMRLAFNTLLLTALAATTMATGRPAGLYFFLLWLMPLGTAFAFFMILRQLVQHGNADMARFTNTRIFLVNPLISMAVFPLGNDYHLPHHVCPMVPFYNLHKLHELLLESEEYRREAIVAQGYFRSAEDPPLHPTVLDLMTH